MSDVMPQDDMTVLFSETEQGWARLRVEREARGLSLNQVSAQLKLTPRQLEAIERGDLSALPGKTFSRGFVRNYARFLKLDPEAFLALIDSIDEPGPVAISSKIYSPSLGRMPTPGNPRFSALPAALVALLLAGALGGGWYFHWFEAREDATLLESATQSEASEEGLIRAPAEVLASTASQPVFAQSEPSTGLAMSASVPPAAVSEPVQRPSVPSVVQSLPLTRQSAPLAGQSPVRVSVAIPVTQQSAVSLVVSQPVANSLPRIVLGFDGESWVEVRDAAGKVVFARMNQAGVVQEVQGSGPFVLVIGNAPKVKLSWKGRPVDLAPYIKGDVARVTVQ